MEFRVPPSLLVALDALGTACIGTNFPVANQTLLMNKEQVHEET